MDQSNSFEIRRCMKAGRIVEVGTHDELMKQENGEYANLYKIQANAYI